jgi:hypothetical protein
MYSTASTESLCLTLALVALSTTTSSASNVLLDHHHQLSAVSECVDQGCSSSSFESATLIHHLPIHLPPLSKDNDDSIAQRNASVYYENNDNQAATSYSEVEEEFELPAELAAMIASADGSSEPPPAAAPTNQNIRYYATYNESGELCSTKATSKFEVWETNYATLDECCEMSFSWDYDACMGL